MIGWGIALIVSVAGIFVILLRRLPEAVRATQAMERDYAASPSEVPVASQQRQESSQNAAVPVRNRQGLTQRLMRTRVFRSNRSQRRNSSADRKDELTPAALAKSAEQLFKDKKFDQAVELYRQLLTAEPREPRWYNRIGSAFLELERFHDARDAFRAALKHGGETAGRYANLAMAEYALGHRLTAMKHMKRAIALSPESDHYEELLRVIESDTGA